MSALSLAMKYSGLDLSDAERMTEQEIREYFTPENFAEMFGEEPDPEMVLSSGTESYSLEECAKAVIQWVRERKE